MNAQEVKDYIGKRNWNKFLKWMRGQTCSMNEDGSTNFYENDVDAFKTKLKTGFDRQNSEAWD